MPSCPSLLRHFRIRSLHRRRAVLLGYRSTECGDGYHDPRTPYTVAMEDSNDLSPQAWHLITLRHRRLV